VIRIVLPRLLRAASFRFAAFYVAVFAGSALVLGVAVFFEARLALQQQMTARIEKGRDISAVAVQSTHRNSKEKRIALEMADLIRRID
jgi:hypothetical protein